MIVSMSYIQNINNISASYFQFEERQTCLNGLKIASYFFTLGLLPLFAGLALGITYCLRGVKKLHPDEIGLHQLIEEAALRINFRQNMIKPFEKGMSLLETLPSDIRENKLKKGLLTLGVIGKLAQSSKTMWHQYQHTVDKAWDQTKAAMTIGKEQWIDAFGIDKMKEVGIDVENIPAPPEYIDEILKGHCPFHPGKRVYQTHRLVLIPAGISINLLVLLMKDLKRGTELDIWNKIVRKIGNLCKEKASWALITCDVIPESANQTQTAQQKMIKNYPGYELPSVLEAMILATMLSRNPWTFTRCRDEKFDGSGPFVVGCLDSSVLSVFCHRCDLADPRFGMIGVRKLA